RFVHVSPSGPSENTGPVPTVRLRVELLRRSRRRHRRVILDGEADALLAVESVVEARAGDEASVAQSRAVGHITRHREVGLEAAVVGGVAVLGPELICG